MESEEKKEALAFDGLTIVSGDRVLVKFEEDYETREYLVDDLSNRERMTIGRMLAAKRKKMAVKDAETARPDYVAPRPAQEPKETEPQPEKVDADPKIAPWDIWTDCPKPGPEGDKTQEVVEWVYANQPEYYRERYMQRKTCVDARLAGERREWIRMGEEYAGRGMHISDCPTYATAPQREYFHLGYRQYLEQTN